MYGRTHSDHFNVPQLLLPGAQLQIKFTKSKKGFYLLVPKNDTKQSSKFVDATYVQRVMPSPAVLLSHMKCLSKVPAQYDLTRLVLKTFTFSSGSQFLSIDNAVLEPAQWSRTRNFLGLASTNPYNFGHFSLTHFVI